MGTLAFGPVPSRRLGQSLGINNVSAKTCSYSCIYCQLGETGTTTMERQTFHKPDEIFKEVAEKLDETASRDERVDYLSFVPDGEPTLDINLGRMIPHLRREGIPVAVFTNSSLIWQEDVQEDEIATVNQPQHRNGIKVI